MSQSLRADNAGLGSRRSHYLSLSDEEPAHSRRQGGWSAAPPGHPTPPVNTHCSSSVMRSQTRCYFLLVWALLCSACFINFHLVVPRCFPQQWEGCHPSWPCSRVWCQHLQQLQKWSTEQRVQRVSTEYLHPFSAEIIISTWTLRN